jgi:hypothetical protein
MALNEGRVNLINTRNYEAQLFFRPRLTYSGGSNVERKLYIILHESFKEFFYMVKVR